MSGKPEKITPVATAVVVETDKYANANWPLTEKIMQNKGLTKLLKVQLHVV